MSWADYLAAEAWLIDLRSPDSWDRGRVVAGKQARAIRRLMVQFELREYGHQTYRTSEP